MLYLPQQLEISTPESTSVPLDADVSIGAVMAGYCRDTVLGLYEDADPDAAQVRWDRWSRASLGFGGTGSVALRFRPLPIRDVRLGEVFGSVQLSYCFPERRPSLTASVRIHGHRLHTVLFERLPGTNGLVAGSREQICSAWRELALEGAVEVRPLGGSAAFPAAVLDEVIAEAGLQLFDTFFSVHRPVPGSPEPMYALRWRRADEVPDLPVTITVGGVTWRPGVIPVTYRPGTDRDVLNSSTVGLGSGVGPDRRFRLQAWS